MSPCSVPLDAIGKIETTIRNLIHDVLSNEFGPRWHENEQAGLGGDWPNSLLEKQRGDAKSRASPVACDIPLSYAEFLDLIKLLEKHQTRFSSVFSNWNALIIYLYQVHRLRNSVKHHREITESQWALLSGIEGEVADAVILWRAGARLERRETLLRFQRRIVTNGKDDATILAESSQVVEELLNAFTEAIGAARVDTSKIHVQRDGEYSGRISAPYMEVVVKTPSDPKRRSQSNGTDYKSATATLVQQKRSRADLDVILRSLAMPYRSIEYVLGGSLDLVALRSWSEQRAGLTVSSSMSTDEVLTSFEVTLLGGRLRIGASNNPSSRVGRLQVLVDDAYGLLGAHRYLGAREILGFMVGDVSPRAMMHLFQESVWANPK